MRKIISKKHKEKTLADFRRQFFGGGTAKGVPVDVLDDTWEQILSFAGYSFCKPHSASYALVSAKSAWLKANYPAEMMSAVISNQGGYYSAFAYVSECRRLGLDILPPDINESAWHYSGRGRIVRVGLMQIQGLTRAGGEIVLKEREKAGRFSNRMTSSGVSGWTGPMPSAWSRAAASTRWKERSGAPSSCGNCCGSPTTGGSASLLFQERVELPSPPPYDEATVLRQEVETLGMLVSRHPLTLYRGALLRHKPVPARDILRCAGRSITMAGWWITTKTVQDKHGRPMEFISFEDTTAIFDATFFPDVYARFCRRLSQQRPYLLKGVVEEEFGVATLRVKWVGFLDG